MSIRSQCSFCIYTSSYLVCQPIHSFPPFLRGYDFCKFNLANLSRIQRQGPPCSQTPHDKQPEAIRPFSPSAGSTNPYPFTLRPRHAYPLIRFDGFGDFHSLLMGFHRSLSYDIPPRRRATWAAVPRARSLSLGIWCRPLAVFSDYDSDTFLAFIAHFVHAQRRRRGLNLFHNLVLHVRRSDLTAFISRLHPMLLLSCSKTFQATTCDAKGELSGLLSSW